MPNTNDLIHMIPGTNKQTNIDIDRLLVNVHDDDKVIVRNVVATMQVLREYPLISNVEVVKNKKGFDVIGTLATNLDSELIITSTDFEIIQSVSPVRISTVMVQVSGKALELVVRVFAHDFPVTFSTVQVTHLSKRTRFV
jgi:hypothetical protein